MEFNTKMVPIIVKIDSRRTAHIFQIMNPTLSEFDYEKDLHNKFLVFDYPNNGQYLIMREELVREKFDFMTIERPWFFNPMLIQKK